MRIVVLVLALSILTGCYDSEPEKLPPLDPPDFSGTGYILNVASVTVTHDYVPPRRPPNVDQLSDITPLDAMKKWASLHLQAGGKTGSLEVDIKDASIIRTDLPKKTKGIEGEFTTEQTEQYDGTLEVEIKIYTPQNPLPMAHVDVTARHRLTLPDNAAPIDRERLYHQMTVGLIKSIKPVLDDQIHQHFANYIM